MKHLRLTIILTVVFLALGTYVWFFERGEVSTPTPSRAAAWRLDVKRIRRITLTCGEQTTVIERVGRQWRIARPISARVDRGSMTELLDRVARVAMRRSIDKPGNLADYGLAKPAAAIEVALAGGGRRAASERRVLLLGDKTPDGSAVYAQQQGRASVFLADVALLDDASAGAAALRSKEIAAIDVADAQRIAIMRGPARFEVRRLGEKRWQLMSPRRPQADASKIEDLLWALSDLRAQGFVDHPGPLASYGLDPPRAAVTIYHARRKQPVRLMFGAAARPASIYLKTAGDVIYEAPAEILTRLPKSADDLRAASRPTKGDPNTSAR
jgi:hypothetical protein